MADEGSSVDKYDVQSDLPSLDWDLNLVLDEISEEMTEEDVDRMKDFCSGEEGIPDGVLSKITNGRSFFKLLRRQQYLDRNNLLYLQAILWNLGKKRRDLYLKLSEFARRCELEPLHFLTEEEQIISGFSHVHFHVSGNDTSRQDIDRLRVLVSKLVRVPLHLVHLNGVKPSQSITITFRLPVDLVGALRKLTPEEKGLLQNEGIDSVFIETDEIRIASKKFEIPEKLKEMDEIEKLLNRNKKLQKELDDVQAQQMKEQQILLNVRKTLMKIQSDLRRPFKGYSEKQTSLGKQEDTSMLKKSKVSCIRASRTESVHHETGSRCIYMIY